MKRLELLDYGRFFAAILVVLFHYTFNGIANGKITSISHMAPIIEITKYGYLGVELFFMISGYVIFFSAKNRTASEFAVSRVIRIYPSYWFAVLFTSCFALQWGGDLMSVDPVKIIANLTMLQSFVGIGHVDGVYWTLVYEISFYAAVVVILLCGLQKNLNSLFICWPILFCIALLFDKQSLPYLGGYYYYFAAGAIFAVLKENPNWFAALSLLTSFLLCIYFSSAQAAQLTQSKGVEYSPIIIGIIVAIFFVFFGFMNIAKAQSLRLPLSGTLGALTYPVYLIHAHFGYMFINKFSTEETKLVVYLLTISIVVCVAFLMHKIVEEMFSYFWRNLFTKTIGRFIDYLHKISIKMQLTWGRYINYD